MLNNDYICALDIGTSKIASALARIKRNRITDITLETVASKGVKRGVITNAIELIDAVSSVLKNLKVKSGINIKFIYVNISGQDIVTKHSQAVIPLAERGNKVITASDIHRVNEQGRILGSILQEEIIHQFPFSYTIDSGSNILNPLGLYSHRLEVDLYLVSSRISSLQSLTRVINQAGYELKKLFFSGLATSRMVFNPGAQQGLSLLCDIGSDITELIVFHDGALKDIDILSLGGDDLTYKLSDELRLPFDVAEEVKRSYGIIGDYSLIKDDKEILLKKSQIYQPIKQKLVSQIITSQAELISKAIKKSMDKRVGASRVNNFVATGGTIRLEGFLEMLEHTLETPVKIGRIIEPDMLSLLHKNEFLSGQKYLNYITALGLICKALDERRPQAVHLNLPAKNPFLRFISKVKEVYQEYF